MAAKGTWTRTICQRVGRVLIAFAVVCAPPAARGSDAVGADGADDDEGALYFGAFWGVQVHTGLVLRADGGPGEGPGPLLGVSARIATLLSLLDLQLSGVTSRYTAHTTAGAGIDVARYSLGLDVHLHPFFIDHLQNDNFHFWKAAIYVAVGAGLEVISADGDGSDEIHPAFGWHLGAGTDIPLGDVTHDWGLWLGIAYRFGFLGAKSGVAGLGDFDEHTILLTLGYRNNDIGFARFPRP